MKEEGKMFPQTVVVGGGKSMRRKELQKGTKKFWGVMNMFIIFIVVMAFQVYACVKTSNCTIK